MRILEAKVKMGRRRDHEEETGGNANAILIKVKETSENSLFFHFQDIFTPLTVPHAKFQSLEISYVFLRQDLLPH
jgi:hypothetical protein